MKQNTKILTALCTAGAMLCSMFPLNAAANTTRTNNGGYSYFYNGDFAVIRVADGYTLVKSLDYAHYPIDYRGLLLLTDEVNSALPEGTPPVQRGDLIRIPDTSALGHCLDASQPDDVNGYQVQSIRKFGKSNNRLLSVRGTAEKIGTVFDDPQYEFFRYDGISESKDIDGRIAQVASFSTRDWENDSYHSAMLPLAVADGTGFEWEAHEKGEWVWMLTCEGVPLFPAESPACTFAAVIAVTEDQYLLSDWNVLNKSDVQRLAGAETSLKCGDMVRYHADTVLQSLPGEPQFGENGVIEYFARAERFYVSDKQYAMLLVTGNDAGKVMLEDEEGNAYTYDCGYDWRTQVACFADAEGISPSDCKPGEICRFVMNGDTPMLPLTRIGVKGEEQTPQHAMIVESVRADRSILQTHSLTPHFGTFVDTGYHDEPFSVSTADLVACLGDYPKAGDILHVKDDSRLGIMTTCLANAVNTGDLHTYGGEPFEEGMIVCSGNILEQFEPKEFTVTIDSEGLWTMPQGAYTNYYLCWNAAWRSVKTGDTVKFAMYYTHPVFPVMETSGDRSLLLTVESVNDEECILRSGRTALRLPIATLTACLGGAPKLGDVLEFSPDAHLIWDHASNALQNGSLYKTEPEEGMVRRLANVIESGETVDYRVLSANVQQGNDLPVVDMWYQNYVFIYWCYDASAYPETAALDWEGLGKNDTVVFGAYQGQPMIPLRIADYVTGDLDNSGSLDILDAILLNKAVLGISDISARARKAGDCDGNGKTDSADCLALLKQILDAA